MTDHATSIVAMKIVTGMIEDVETRRLITTEVRPVETADLRELGSGWNFDWRAAVEDVEVRGQDSP
jgi:hypothetical protein